MIHYFYVTEEQTVGRCEQSGGNYHSGQIYRDGEWVKKNAGELLTEARPIDKEDAEKRIGAAAIAKK